MDTSTADSPGSGRRSRRSPAGHLRIGLDARRRPLEGSFEGVERGVREPGEPPGPHVATKCASALAAARTWMPVLAETGTFVPYKNGLLGNQMAEIAGERLVECAVYYPATLAARGHSQLTGPGHLHLGPWPRGSVGNGSRAARVADLLSAVVPTYAYADMFSVRWNKLVVNAAMTSLGGFVGTRDGKNDEAFSDPEGVVAESLTIAEAVGAKPMSLGGFDAGRIVRLPRFVAEIGLRVATRKHGLYKSSSQQSLEREEPTEVGFLNGRIVEEASRLKMAAPWNAAVHHIVNV